MKCSRARNDTYLAKFFIVKRIADDLTGDSDSMTYQSLHYWPGGDSEYFTAMICHICLSLTPLHPLATDIMFRTGFSM